MDLVTLSACQTRLGRMEHGEGVLGSEARVPGRGRAQHAVSLWSVDDHLTAVLIEVFCRHPITGHEDRATRLALAKCKLLALADSGSPSCWAPFVLVEAPGGMER